MQIGNFNTDKKVFIIAELSANHAGSLEMALKSIKAAKKAGADAIKIQTYTADSLTLNSNKEDFIIKGGFGIKENFMSFMKVQKLLMSGILKSLKLHKMKAYFVFQVLLPKKI